MIRKIRLISPDFPAPPAYNSPVRIFRPSTLPFIMSTSIQTTISPYSQKPILTRPLQSKEQLDNAISQAVKAGKSWKKVPLDDRIAIAEKWLVRHAVDFSIVKC